MSRSPDFFYVLHEISERMLHFHRRAECLKIIPAVSFKEIGVLMRRLHPVVFGTVIFRFHDLSDHSPGGNVEDTVKMQSSGFSAALPYTNMLPALRFTRCLNVFRSDFRKLSSVCSSSENVNVPKKFHSLCRFTFLDKRTFLRMAFVFFRSCSAQYIFSVALYPE